MIKAADLIGKFREALDNQYGYIWGKASKSLLTPRRALTWKEEGPPNKGAGACKPQTSPHPHRHCISLARTQRRCLAPFMHNKTVMKAAGVRSYSAQEAPVSGEE